MQIQPVKRGQIRNLQGEGLKRILVEVFGEECVRESGEKYEVFYGALSPLRTWLEGRGLAVETVMKKDVDEEEAKDTIKKYNQFLERATGYTARERIKRARRGA